MRRVLSTATLLGLLVATAAAFVITEHLKLVKGPVAGTKVTKTFSPVCRCATDRASIRLRLRRPDALTVTIEDATGRTVATLASRVQEPKGFVTFRWNGRTDAGAVVRDGAYRPQVELANARRTILLPNWIAVDTTAPRVLAARAGGEILVPGGKHTVDIRYRLSEKAQAFLYLHGRRIVLGRRTRRDSKLNWNGFLDGSPLPYGRHVLELGAVDAAGNETPASGRKRIVIDLRPLALLPLQLTARPGERLAVSVRTTARKYAWRLGGRHGTGRGPVLRVRAPLRPGRYRLVVTARGHSAVALVDVRRRK